MRDGRASLEARRAVIVFFGGGLGATFRDLLLLAFPAWNSPFPAVVLAINLLGAFLLGIVYALGDEVGLLRAEVRLFVGVGMMGGFTTFSTLAWGADLLVRHAAGIALLYACVSIAGGAVVALLGISSGRALVALIYRAAAGIVQRLEGGGGGTGRPEQDIGAIDLEDREGTA